MPSRRTLANAIRALSMDAVQQANSGHPGMPMGMADIAEVLWNDFLRHNPQNPAWPNRDRFILSNGHGSMLQYALLHLTGYDLDINELKRFRQLNSKTPGHPEYGYTPGVETTTGPLGQGLANAVGMALAEKILGEQFNQPGYNIIDHYTYVFVGDGCLMEGISHEVCSFAGTLGLGKLIAFWDDNGISIDGEVKDWFTDNTPARFKAYNWHVIENVDGHNANEIFQAITAAREVLDKPTLICCRTTIGYGAPNAAGTAECHGAPLGAEEINAARQQLNWLHPPFVIPKEIYQAWNANKCGAAREKAWQEKFAAYQKAFPDLAQELQRRLEAKLPSTWTDTFHKLLQEYAYNQPVMATRKASQQVLNAIAPMLPELLGGSADLTGSNLTNWSGSVDITHDHPNGNYLHYGVREFGMSGMMNGIALHDGFIPYGGTFLVFHSYAANAVRMSALMKKRVIYVYTHDSIGLGEDGPTHQPIEQIASLRMTPNMTVWRPADLAETLVAWQAAIEQQQGPSALLLSRQSLPALKHDLQTIATIKRGGYILMDCPQQPELILIATGSEVSLAVNAATQLIEQGKQVRVVSMPSCEVFLAQDKEYQEAVLPSSCKARIAIEAAASDYWYKFVGLEGKIVGLNRFGESAPAADLFNAFGFTKENIMAVAAELLK